MPDPRWFAGLARVLEAAAREARAIAEEQTDVHDGWLDQSASPMGPRRHAAAVRRRMAAGLPGAGRAGRRFLLSPAALAEELGGAPAAPADDADAELEAMRSELRMVRGGRR